MRSGKAEIILGRRPGLPRRRLEPPLGAMKEVITQDIFPNKTNL